MALFFRHLLFVTVWCCLADCNANICCQSANNLQWDSFHPCEWRVWLNLHFFRLILSTSKVFFKNVLSSFKQYIHSCVSTGSAPRFIVISHPPSLTLCTLLLSGLAPCLLFCLGMGGWARGRGWAAHEQGRKKKWCSCHFHLSLQLPLSLKRSKIEALTSCPPVAILLRPCRSKIETCKHDRMRLSWISLRCWQR